MKNLLIINPWIGNIGPNTFLKNFYRNLDTSKISLTVIYPLKDFISEEMETMGINVIYNNNLSLKHVKNKILKPFIRFIKEFNLLFFFILLFRKKKFHKCLVNTEIYSFALIVPWCFSEVYVVVHSLSFVHNGYLNKIVLLAQKKFVYKYLAVSKIVKTSLEKKGVKKNVHLAYNGVDFQLVKEKKKIKEDLFQIISIVHPVPHKGAHHLLDVINILKNKIKFKWIILGWYSESSDKEYEKILLSEIDRLKLNEHIQVYGNVNNITNWYNKSDLMVHPSESESFGFAVAEAMSFGLPVVAFEVGALPEIIDTGVNGTLIPPFNKELMAISIEKILNDEKARIKMGIEAKLKIDTNFNIKTQMQNVFQIIGLYNCQ